MRLAVIDLGTNTFHLIIAEQNAGELQIIYKTNQPVKLGEDITKNNLIIPTAFERGITCLQDFKAEIDKYEIDVVKATATSGVRSAKNGMDFVEAAKERAGIEIDIIDGDEEAQYIYEGVKWSGAITGKSLIMDIGGGSTEFILCDEESLVWKKSYNIGAARLMQAFFNSDPINETDTSSIINHLAEELKALKIICNEYAPETLIGSAGAFETFAGMINDDIDIKTIATADIPLLDYKNLAAQLIQSTHQERANMEGLIPLRVDMIVMASILTNYILDEFGIKTIKLSTYDLKMGVLQSLKS
ncbi:exopolyphosphatase [Pedobacter frigiditerrae]|uniref:Exopolyphosphatase n=1 Tax=Pedobacter frigiditerrae TaxID=2530452 RepID=A0A4R0MXV7_9SPHI|nr:exopolyphosphatase [Pedobacter frigiditerrae]TCC92090.1 exopolyphosphatase [Pedobacter frigiditerrae]